MDEQSNPSVRDELEQSLEAAVVETVEGGE
jgi:hypothetical protein